MPCNALSQGINVSDFTEPVPEITEGSDFKETTIFSDLIDTQDYT